MRAAKAADFKFALRILSGIVMTKKTLKKKTATKKPVLGNGGKKS
jgi:hypothetical protein